ncbi:MAG TPA: hypothetical protein VMR70_19760 [Flavisolibacter sp.]|nr:hypothetical protein [Flavisolibacter sp.]
MVNTVTSYRSPVRLVKHAAEETEVFSPQAISRTRKRLMAEIMLIGDEIVIDDVAYSRNDASTLLDAVTEQSWKAHHTIFAHKGLLDFLEKEEFNNEELRKADAYLYNAAFVQAVSPYFAHSFNTVSGRLLRQEAFDELLQLLDFQGYILPEHSHEAYQKIRTYLDELNYTLRNLSWEKFFEDESVLHFIFSDEWKRCINKLPSSFTSLRDELVEQMINLVLRFQHKATWYYLHQVLVQLKTIETNEYNRSEVERIDKIIYENSRIEGGKGNRSAKSDGEFSTGRVVWWLIWAIFIVIRIATCDNRSSKSSYENFPFENVTTVEEEGNAVEGENEKILLSSLDSLSQEAAPVVVQKIKTGDQPFEGLGDDPGAARNDSMKIVNQSDYDAVFFYFKNLPGHYKAGLLPKLYATYIKKGESETVYVLPGNGRVYFAFGEGWGKLKKPLKLRFSKALASTQSDVTSETITVTHFFAGKKPVDQPFLQNPVYIDHYAGSRYGDNYQPLNVESGDPRKITELRLHNDDGFLTIAAVGRLSVTLKKDTKQTGPPPEAAPRE